MTDSTPRKPLGKLSLKRADDTAAPAAKAEERLHKVLAQAGLGSRRALEQRIADGLVKVNGEVAQVGQSIRSGDRVELDGKAFVASALTDATGMAPSESMPADPGAMTSAPPAKPAAKKAAPKKAAPKKAAAKAKAAKKPMKKAAKATKKKAAKKMAGRAKKAAGKARKAAKKPAKRSMKMGRKGSKKR